MLLFLLHRFNQISICWISSQFKPGILFRFHFCSLSLVLGHILQFLLRKTALLLNDSLYQRTLPCELLCINHLLLLLSQRFAEQIIAPSLTFKATETHTSYLCTFGLHPSYKTVDRTLNLLFLVRFSFVTSTGILLLQGNLHMMLLKSCIPLLYLLFLLPIQRGLNLKSIFLIDDIVLDLLDIYLIALNELGISTTGLGVRHCGDIKVIFQQYLSGE